MEDSIIAGTKSGGVQAAITNKQRDPDFYRKIGSVGGKRSNNGGFGSKKVGADGLTGLERARMAGKIGGELSKRTK